MSKQITLTIKDNKYPFFIELMNNFDFVKIDETYFPEPSKDEILQGIEEGFIEAKLYDEGKIELKSATELLHEL